MAERDRETEKEDNVQPRFLLRRGSNKRCCGRGGKEQVEGIGGEKEQTHG